MRGSALKLVNILEIGKVVIECKEDSGMRYNDMLLSQHSVNPPILTAGLEDFKIAFVGGLGDFQNN